MFFLSVPILKHFRVSLHLEFIKDSRCKQFCDFYHDSILNISEPALQLDVKQMKRILPKNIMSQSDTLKIEICRSKSEGIIKGAECKVHQRVCLSEKTMAAIPKTALPSGFPREVAKFLKNVDNIKKGKSFFGALLLKCILKLIHFECQLMKKITLSTWL